MLRGLYTAASGMLHELARNDTAAANLAFINSAGYKKDIVVSRAFPEMLLHRINDNVIKTPAGAIDLRPEVGTLGTGVAVDEIFTVHTQGLLRQSDAPLDVAILGEGFFTVRTPAGERYTRCGNFTLDAAGTLVTTEGFPVLDAAGNPVTIEGHDIIIAPDGSITADGSEVAQLRPVDFADKTSLVREGSKLYAAPPEAGAPTPASRTDIRQGYIEMSNVEPVLEMTNLISILRTYEANQKMIQAQDRMLEQAVNEIARM